MKSSYDTYKMNLFKFSDIIEEVIERNSNLEYNLEHIVGVTIEKGLMPTIANLTQTALDKFYLVKPQTFVYNPRTHGVRLGMGYNQTDNTFITSWNNVAFRVKNEALSFINPNYLWLYFNRPEWDRETNYRAWGSSTIVFAWNTFLNMTLKVPPKYIQDEIVRRYSAIENRIKLKKKINDNLEATARAFWESKVTNVNNKKPISSFGNVITGKTPSTNISEYYGIDVPFIKTPDMHNKIYITSSECYLSKLGADSQSNKYIPANSVIVACIGANAGEVAITSYIAQTNQQINAVISEYPCFLYFSIKANTEELRTLGDGSSTMLNINKSSFESFEILTPENEVLNIIETKLETIFSSILTNLREIEHLKEAQYLLISKLSR